MMDMRESEKKQLYEMLHWQKPKEIQQQGVRIARGIKDLSVLIQPPASASVWEKCACILAEKTDDELVPYLSDLLEWLQDLNTPGALDILKRLKIMDGTKLAKPFIQSCEQAKSLELIQMNQWLDYLSDLLDNESLKACLAYPLLGELLRHYHNWGEW